MLGGAEASKIDADVDAKKTGGMFLRITQNGEVCTVDASFAKFARAVRTWKSGHYPPTGNLSSCFFYSGGVNFLMQLQFLAPVELFFKQLKGYSF